MIPKPNLDDRRFEDIVQEAIRLIPQYTPEWTNHNRADPGVTLIELFAWMTEMTLYRLNRVPEKNFLAFLELMGVTLMPPQPARTVVQFTINPKADRVLVPRGTQIATRPGPDGASQTFETSRDLAVTSNRLVKCISQLHDAFSDNTAVLPGAGDQDDAAARAVGRSEGVPLWHGARAVERFLYLSDPRLESFHETSMLSVESVSPEAPTPIVRMLDWECFDGARWRPLKRASIDTPETEVALLGPPAIAPVSVSDDEALWIRGRLAEVPQSAAATETDTLKMRLEIVGEGELPDIAFAQLEGDLFLRLDLDRNVQPFGREPMLESAFYVQSDRVFGHSDAEVRIDVELADPAVAPSPRPSDDLVVVWEYHNGKRWKFLGRNGFGEYDEEDQGHVFVDETECLTQSGTISFQRPKDWRACKVNGVTGHFVRGRIERGGFGVRGSYELENDKWVWKDPQPLRPPTVRNLTLRFAEAFKPFAKVLAYNDFVYTDHTAPAREEMKAFQPFTPVSEESPTVYLGFAEPFPNEGHQIFFEMASSEGAGQRLRAGQGETARSLEQAHAEQVIAWEYFNGREWSSLLVRDQTHGFTQSGFVEFVAPKDHRSTKRYGENLYWVRARLEFGGYDEPPMLRDVLLNAVFADNLVTWGETLLGSSRGTPNQRFRFPRGPVLPGQEIWVREREKPSERDLARLIALEGEDCVREDEENDAFLVRWHQVESLYESTSDDRHYTKDLVTNEISFGDGVHGMVPPKGDRNIVCSRYQVGGGASGNVPPESISVLLQSVAYVTSVRNVFAASGGCDLETVEEAKLRGPHSIKSLGRAVTAEDFEWLARESSNSVARVCALPTLDREGEVTVVIVPKVAESHPDFFAEKPLASSELLRKVRNYLADRKLLTTVLNVQRPVFRELKVTVEIIVLQAAAADRVKREITERVRRFLHPLVGGKLGEGWPFGRPVYRVDLYHVVEEVPGVDFVDRVRLVDEETRLEVDQFKLDAGELVHVVDVEIVEKAHERIIR